MDLRLTATICSLAGAAGLTIMGAAPAVAAQGGDFAGTWVSVDTDGSNQVMTIRGSGRGSYGVQLYDDAATVCGGVPARFGGSGHVVEDDVLVVRGSVVCLPGGNPLRGAIDLVLISDGGTLVDGGGVVWSPA